MRFLFVSRITEIEGKKIRGQVDFSAGEPWRRKGAKAECIISTSVISEAIGQLVSWMTLKDNDFSGRPVFLFATTIHLDQGVPAPATVDLEAWITDQSEDSFIFSGTAKFAGKTVVEIQDCGGYFMPLTELEDPVITRQRLITLSQEGLQANPSESAFDFSSLVDAILDLKPGQSITTTKQFLVHEPFYADHFPRFPVTPIVVINEMITEATKRLFKQCSPAGVTVTPVAVQDLKIKSFIRPGDTAVVHVNITETNDSLFETIAEISVNQKRILRGRYRFQLS
jgi:3-hydroxymyristoyl/3-hydroxydecanoyl-(acyl carrier protein) dehydratase